MEDVRIEHDVSMLNRRRELIELRIEQIKSEYRLLKFAVLFGWLPFSIIGYRIVEILPDISSAIFFQRDIIEPSSSTIFTAITLFTILIAGYIAFFALVFIRRAKLRVELTDSYFLVDVDIGELSSKEVDHLESSDLPSKTWLSGRI